MHNPFGFIKRVLDAKCNNPSVAVTSSSRGAALLSLPNRDARWNVTGLGDIEFEGNTLSFERVEHTDNRAMANFDDLLEIEANDFPHELWHEDGVKYFFAHLGSVCALDQYCIDSGDFVNVCAMVMVTCGMHLPPGMVVLLPGRDLITVSLTQLAFHAHGIGPDDPSPLSSDDGSDSDSYDFHDAATHETTLLEFADRARARGPPPSWHGSIWTRCANASAKKKRYEAPAPTMIALQPGAALPALLIPTASSALSPAAPLAPHDTSATLFVPTSTAHAYDEAPILPVVSNTVPTLLAPSTLPSQPLSIVLHTLPRAADNAAVSPHLVAPVGPKAFSSSSTAISNLDIHDNVIRKRVVYSQHVVSASKLHRSARIADRETPFYSTVAEKALHLKASRFNLAKASDDLVADVHGSSLCLSEGEASDADDAADKFTHIALVCRANTDEADAIRAAGALPSP
ncbi:hypothetical protein ZWY2020_049101 [Hordeum vulgare]|nr:hypothetical protein ZWY2020_049101 [Hordeum vulgare]